MLRVSSVLALSRTFDIDLRRDDKLSYSSILRLLSNNLI